MQTTLLPTPSETTFQLCSTVLKCAQVCSRPRMCLGGPGYPNRVPEQRANGEPAGKPLAEKEALGKRRSVGSGRRPVIQ